VAYTLLSRDKAKFEDLETQGKNFGISLKQRTSSNF
jgi:hypothetical protein